MLLIQYFKIILFDFYSSETNGSLILKRSRSLPQEEFIYLTQKLRELDLIQRTDSIISGQSARYVKCREKNGTGIATLNAKSIFARC